MGSGGSGWTGAQFSLLRIASGLAALHWAVSHWEWTPPLLLPVASAMMALGWFTRWAALIVFALAPPLLSAAMPLFVLAPEGPYGAVHQFDNWRIPAATVWSARAATLAVLVFAAPPAWWPMGIFAALAVASPAWMPGREPGSLDRLYYDGHCGLCHNFIQFLLSEDADGARFRFAPLDSDSFREHIPEATRAALPDSVVIWTSAGRALTKSAAVLHVLGRLGGLWRVIGMLAWPLPTALLDGLYDFMARVRHRLFAQPDAVCPLMPKALRSRFDV